MNLFAGFRIRSSPLVDVVLRDLDAIKANQFWQNIVSIIRCFALNPIDDSIRDVLYFNYVYIAMVTFIRPNFCLPKIILIRKKSLEMYVNL